MSGFNKNELDIFKKIASMSEKNLKKAMVKILTNSDYTVYEYDNYVIAEGDIPIALVAHMDTVFHTPPKEIFYDEKQHVMWSPQGLGADDRAGVFAIIKIISSGYKPSIVLTCGEETGGIGAMDLAKSGACPFTNLKYVIEIDRQGKSDCVFYDCDNRDFVEYVESFGFLEAYGTFTDISILCPAWGVAGVNLSSGYKNEHSLGEILYTNALKSTIEKTISMLEDAINVKEPFNYIPTLSYNQLGLNSRLADIEIICDKCHRLVKYKDGFAVEKSLTDTDFVCMDCLDGTIEWCNMCGSAYYDDPSLKINHMCRECMEVYCGTGPKVTYPASK